MSLDWTGTAVAASRNQQCRTSLQQTLMLTRLVQKESVDLIKTYKSSQGDISDLFCTVSVSDVPDPDISGMETSERMASVLAHFQAFLPHLRRVLEQQTDLQPPASPLLAQLARLGVCSGRLALSVDGLYRSLFPNLPAPERPAGGPTALPPAQNTFQQKVYGCAVLKTYREFLSNVARELKKTLRSRACRLQHKVQTNALL